MSATPEPRSAIATMREAMEAGEPDRASDAFAPDVIVRSPITSSFEFRGRDQVRDLLRDVVAALGPSHYVEEIGEGDTRVLLARVVVGGQEINEAIVTRLRPDGLIAEMTLYVRPLPGLTTMAARIGPRVAGHRGRWRRVVLTAMLAPLAFASRRGEVVAAKIASP